MRGATSILRNAHPTHSVAPFREKNMQRWKKWTLAGVALLAILVATGVAFPFLVECEVIGMSTSNGGYAETTKCPWWWPFGG